MVGLWPNPSTSTLQINLAYPNEQLSFSSLNQNLTLFKRSVVGLQATNVNLLHTTVGLWPNLSPQHYKSTQDTLLSNFHFLHYTQIFHCSKEHWWAFSPTLLATGPILNASAGRYHLRGHNKTILFPDLHILVTRGILAILEDFWTEKNKNT